MPADMEVTPKTPIWRVLAAYVLGCVLAGIWVTIYIGGSPFTFDPETYEPIEVGLIDHIGTAILMVAIALAGCLIPVGVGRGIMMVMGTRSAVLFALIWALAGTFVAGGTNLFSWARNAPELLLGYFLPGAVIGAVVWWVETGGIRP